MNRVNYFCWLFYYFDCFCFKELVYDVCFVWFDIIIYLNKCCIYDYG